MSPWTNTLIVLKKIAKSIICKICYRPAKEPQTVGQCGHFACLECLLSLKKSHCPECSQQFYPQDLVPDAVAKAILEEWRFICGVVGMKFDENEQEYLGVKEKFDVIPNVNENHLTPVNNFNKDDVEFSSFASQVIIPPNICITDGKKENSINIDNISNTIKENNVKKSNLSQLNNSKSECSYSDKGVLNTKNKIVESKGLNTSFNDKDKKYLNSKKSPSDSSSGGECIGYDRNECNWVNTNTKRKSIDSIQGVEDALLDSDDFFKKSKKFKKDNQIKKFVFRTDERETLRPKRSYSKNLTKTHVSNLSIYRNGKQTSSENPKCNKLEKRKIMPDLGTNHVIKKTPTRVAKQSNSTIEENKNKSSKNGKHEEKGNIYALNIVSSPKNMFSDVSSPTSSLSFSKLYKKKKRDFVNKINTKGETPLQVACKKGKLNEVKRLLAEGASPNTKDYAGWTPLHEAVERCDWVLVEILLDSGAYVNVPGHLNVTPLLEAVSKDQVEISRMLLQRGANIYLRSCYNYLPMDCAQSDEMKKLLSAYEKRTPTFGKQIINDGSTFETAAVPEPCVLFGVSLEHNEITALEHFCSLHNVIRVDAFRKEISHLVIKDSNDGGKLVSPLELNVLRAIVNGISVINFDWIKSCLKEGKLLDSDVWEIKGTPAYPTSEPSKKSRLSYTKLLPKLFDGLHVYLSIYWLKDGELSKRYVTDLLTEGGASLLAREPDAESIPVEEATVMFHADMNGPMAKCSHVILYSSNGNSQEPPLKYNMKHIKTLSVKWVVDCIQAYSILDPTNYI